MLVKQNICKSELFPAPIFFYNERICKFYSVLQFWLSSKKMSSENNSLCVLFSPQHRKILSEGTLLVLVLKFGIKHSTLGSAKIDLKAPFVCYDLLMSLIASAQLKLLWQFPYPRITSIIHW